MKHCCIGANNTENIFALMSMEKEAKSQLNLDPLSPTMIIS